MELKFKRHLFKPGCIFSLEILTNTKIYLTRANRIGVFFRQSCNGFNLFLAASRSELYLRLY